jgi:hypothetical protein
MTPTELEQAARERYNSVGSRFWSQNEIFTLIYNAQVDLCNRTFAVEKTYQTTTIAGTQDYDLPSTCIAVKRATFDGFKLEAINFTDDDLITGFEDDTTAQGDSRYFWIWGNSISLRPIPSTAGTLKIWTLNMPATVTSTSTLDVHAKFHPWLIDYVVSFMVAKDENYTLSKYYLELWESNIIKAQDLIRRSKNSRGYNFVRDEDVTGISIVSTV